MRVDDIGTELEITMMDGDAVLPIGTAAERHIWLKKPSGAVLERTGSLVTDGADGKMSYTTIAGDIDMAGPWLLQGFVVFPSGAWHTQIEEFLVEASLI